MSSSEEEDNGDKNARTGDKGALPPTAEPNMDWEGFMGLQRVMETLRGRAGDNSSSEESDESPEPPPRNPTPEPQPPEVPSKYENDPRFLGFEAGAFRAYTDCLRGLPLDQSKLTEKMVRNLLSKLKRIDVSSPKMVCRQGEMSDGIYILMKGGANVISQGDNVVIANLAKGEFFGEVSTLYGIPSTADVQVSSSSCLCQIPKGPLWELPLQIDLGLIDWFATRRYLPTSDSIDTLETTKQTVITALKNIPTFEKWPEETLEDFLETANLIKLDIVYPEGSSIVLPGDPGQELMILLRGRAKIGKQEIDARRCPYTIEEEGMFMDKDHRIRMKAITCCQVCQIQKCWMVEARNKHFQETGSKWSEANHKWSEFIQRRNKDLFNRFPDNLQTESIYHYIISSEIFKGCDPGFASEIMMNSKAYEYGSNETCLNSSEYQEGTVLILMSGRCHLFDYKSKKSFYSFEPGDIFWKSKWMPKTAEIRTDDDCLVMKILNSIVKKALNKYPKSKVYDLLGKD